MNLPKSLSLKSCYLLLSVKLAINRGFSEIRNTYYSENTLHLEYRFKPRLRVANLINSIPFVRPPKLMTFKLIQILKRVDTGFRSFEADNFQ